MVSELRALIADLDRLAFLVFPLIGDRVGLRAPFPFADDFAITGIPGVADRLDLPKRIKADLGDLLDNRGALVPS